MNTKTYKLPDRRVARSQSMRRFVMFHVPDDLGTDPYPVKRSDTLENLRGYLRTGRFVLDTTTGQPVQGWSRVTGVEWKPIAER